MVHLPLLDRTKKSTSLFPWEQERWNRRHRRGEKSPPPTPCRPDKPLPPPDAAAMRMQPQPWNSSKPSSVQSYYNRQEDVLDLSHYEDDYLLRLCQKNDWRTVERMCGAISKMIKQQQQTRPAALDMACSSSETTLQGMKQARKQLQTVDQWGNTALHLVCYHKPPAYVVSALLEACKLAATTTNTFPDTRQDHLDDHSDPWPLLVLYPNHQGATPLLIACRSGACQQVLQLLMQSESRALLSRRHQAVQWSDYEGNTAFTGLVQRYTMLCKVPQYKRYCTSLYARAMYDHENQNGNLEITFDGVQFDLSSSHNSMPWDENGSAEAIDKENSISPSNTSTTMTPESFLRGQTRNTNAARIFPELWENISLLLDAAWKDDSSFHEPSRSLRQLLQAGRNSRDQEEGVASSSSSSWFDHPIHVTAMVADALPTNIIDLLLRLYHQDWSKHKDYDVVHPLHFAVFVVGGGGVENDDKQEEQCGGGGGCSCPYHLNQERRIAAMRRRSHLMERLLSMDPPSARLGMPNGSTNHKNRFVFHQAIASGLTWHVAANGEPGPVAILFRAAPELLTVRDGETGLYPFQMAAVAAAAASMEPSVYSHHHHHHKEEEESPPLHLDTIFQLLRKAPELLARGV